MGKTTIEWCDYSANPIRGRDMRTNKVGHFCEKISPGCAHCYASRYQLRRGLKEFSDPKRGQMQMFLHNKTLDEVMRRQTPTRIFWEDMSDLFGEWVQNKWLDEIFTVMALTKQHTHLVLTKRVESAYRYIRLRAKQHGQIPDFARSYMERFPKYADVISPPWPLPNVFIGASIENQPYANARIPTLFGIPAAGRFLSIEPQLGPITIKYAACTCPNRDEAFKTKRHEKECYAERINKYLTDVIVGGESGPGARPFNLQWPRSIVRQCRDLGVAVFVKQLGAFPTLTPIGTAAFEDKPTKIIRLKQKSRKGSDPAEWPDDLRVQDRLWQRKVAA